jgi:hypothetical protein
MRIRNVEVAPLCEVEPLCKAQIYLFFDLVKDPVFTHCNKKRFSSNEIQLELGLKFYGPLWAMFINCAKQ